MAFLNSLPGVVNQGLVWGIMAIGLFLTFKLLNFADLTVDGSLAFGGMICAVLINNGVNAWLAIILAFLGGALAGAITGLLSSYCGIPGILAGILTQFMLYSINLVIAGGAANIAINSNTYYVIIAQKDLYISMGVLFGFVAVIGVVLYWFFGTENGSAIRATGANATMARANGINTKVSTIVCLAISNGLVALAGAMLAQYQGFADVKMGTGAIVVGLAAIVIGGTIFGKIHNFGVQLGGCVVGAILYYLVYQIVIMLGLNANLFKLFSAVVVILFLAIPYFISLRKKKSKYVRN